MGLGGFGVLLLEDGRSSTAAGGRGEEHGMLGKTIPTALQLHRHAAAARFALAPICRARAEELIGRLRLAASLPAPGPPR